MNKSIKPVSLAIGAAFVGTFALSQSAFAMSDLDQGYMQSSINSHVAGVLGEGKDAEGKCGEGKCGGDKAEGEGHDKEGAEGKCGEGKCGGDKAEGEGDKGGEGKCGGSH